MPHGFSVILNAPAVFRFTASVEPRAAYGKRRRRWEWMFPAATKRTRAHSAERITWFMQRLKTPNGLREIGYTPVRHSELVEGTLPQHRVTKLSPLPAGPEELSALFKMRWSRW